MLIATYTTALAATSKTLLPNRVTIFGLTNSLDVIELTKVVKEYLKI